MPRDAIVEITQTEQQAQTRLTEATAEAKHLVESARQAGQTLLDSATAQARQQAKQLMIQAEEAAARDEEVPAMGLPASGFISV